MLSVYIGAPVVSGIVHECVSLLYQCLLLINANSLPALKSSTFGVRFFFLLSNAVAICRFDRGVI